MLGLCRPCRRSSEQRSSVTEMPPVQMQPIMRESLTANHGARKAGQDCCLDRPKELPCGVRLP